MPSILVIYNPSAGRGRVQALWPEVEAALLQAKVDFEAVATRAPQEAIALARQAVRNFAAVVGVGGDGTLHEIANGLLQASAEGETIPLGAIPLGNGDDFAKVLPPAAEVGGKSFDWRQAVEIIARGQSQSFDVVRMLGDHPRYEPEGSPHYFINGMDVGFGAHTVRNFTTVPKVLKGISAYLAAVLNTLLDYPVLRLRIQLDDQPPFPQATVMTAIMNGRCFGNGFWAAPHAAPDDGLLDLLIGADIDRLSILRLIPKIMAGAHENEPAIRMARARRVVLESDAPLLVEADGELPYLEAHCLEIEVLPKRLRVMV
jgi:diacylglycerol kinase (ATP)